MFLSLIANCRYSRSKGFLGLLFLAIAVSASILLMIPVIQSRHRATSALKIERQQRTEQRIRQAISDWKEAHILEFFHTFDVSSTVSSTISYPLLFPEKLVDLVSAGYLDLKDTSLSLCYPDATGTPTRLCDEWSNPLLYYSYTSAPFLPSGVLPDQVCPLVWRYSLSTSAQLEVTSKIVPSAVVIFQNRLTPAVTSNTHSLLNSEMVARAHYDALLSSVADSQGKMLTLEDFNTLRAQPRYACDSSNPSYICDDTILLFDASELSDKFSVMLEEILQNVANAALISWNNAYLSILDREASKYHLSVAEYIERFFVLQPTLKNGFVYLTSEFVKDVCQEANQLTFGDALTTRAPWTASEPATSVVVLPTDYSIGSPTTLIQKLESLTELALDLSGRTTTSRTRLPFRFECRCRTATGADVSCFSSTADDLKYTINDGSTVIPRHFTSIYLKASLALDYMRTTSQCPVIEVDSPSFWE